MKDYSYAYAEVLEVLKYIPKSDYEQIPKKTIQLLEANCDEQSDFTYNIGLPFDKQNISKDAKVVLAILYRNCWLKNEEKTQFLRLEEEYIQNIEEEKRKKYNPEKLFEDNKLKEQSILEELQENNYLIVKEEKWYIKFWNKIKAIIKK